MVQQVAVDVGYGFTKAVSDGGGRCCFPSVVAPVRGAGDLASLAGGRALAHRIDVQRAGAEAEAHLVGEAALAAGGVRSWHQDAASRPDYALLTLTAVALLGGEGRIDLAVGLPVGIWAQRGSRRALRERLVGLSAWVSADGEVACYVEVGACQVLPQALGAYVAALSADGALARGRYGVVDVGFRTTDLVLLTPNADGVPVPDDARSGSVDAGIGLAYEAVRQQVERESGLLWDEGIVLAALRGDVVLRVRGAARALRVPFGKGARSLAERVEAAVRRLWADQLEFLDGLLLAGGGGEALLPALGLPGMRPVEGGIYANAEGFLRQMAVSGRMA